MEKAIVCKLLMHIAASRWHVVKHFQAEIPGSPTRVNVLLGKFRFPLGFLNPKEEDGEEEGKGPSNLSQAGIEVGRDGRKPRH